MSGEVKFDKHSTLLLGVDIKMQRKSDSKIRLKKSDLFLIIYETI